MNGLGFELIEEGFEREARRIREETKLFQAAQRKQMRQATNLIRNAVRSQIGAKFTRRRGKFRSSIGTSVRRVGLEIVGRVLLRRRQYYTVHETGKVITARKSPYLVFPSKDGTGLVRVRSVTIPARPVFAPALAAKREQAIAIVGESFNPFLGTASA